MESRKTCTSKIARGGGVGGCLPKSKHRSLWLSGGPPFLAASLGTTTGSPILLPIQCLYKRRSFDQQRLLGSTVHSTTPTPRDNTDKDYARSIDTDIFANKDPRIALKPSVTDRRRHENSFRRGPYFRGAPSTRESVRLRQGHSYLFFQYPSR